MNFKRVIVSQLVAGAFLGCSLLAQAPPRNVNPGRHPNLAAAQRLTDQAFHRITDAQQANEFDMAGHAAKAKDLLDQADNELKQAAHAANEHGAAGQGGTGREPVDNTSGKKHPNLNAAQRLAQQAFTKITAAQQANEFDMQGHAAKAKDLLDQANRELKQAAEAANRNKK